MSDLSAAHPFTLQSFMSALRDNCIIINASASDNSSISSWQKNMWESVCKVSSHSNRLFTVSYCLPEIIGMYSGLVWNLTREDLHTPVFYSGVKILDGYMVTSISTSANDVTAGSIICSADSRVPYYFSIPISCSC